MADDESPSSKRARTESEAVTIQDDEAASTVTATTPPNPDAATDVPAEIKDEPFEPPDLFNDDVNDFSESGHHRAFQGALLNIDITPKSKKRDLNKFLSHLRTQLHAKLSALLEERGGIKACVSVEVSYKKAKGKSKVGHNHLTTSNHIVFNDFELDDQIEDMLTQLISRNSHFIREQSGLVIKELHRATLRVSTHQPLAGSSFQPLPDPIKKKKAVINVHNTDQRCFGYALLSALHPPKQNAHRPNKYDGYFPQHHLDDISYPVEPRQIPKLED